MIGIILILNKIALLMKLAINENVENVLFMFVRMKQCESLSAFSLSGDALWKIVNFFLM